MRSAHAFEGEGRSFDVVVMMMIVPRSRMAPDIARAGSRPFLALIRLVPRTVESRGGRRPGVTPYPVCAKAPRRRDNGGGEADQSDCLEHGSFSTRRRGP